MENRRAAEYAKLLELLEADDRSERERLEAVRERLLWSWQTPGAFVLEALERGRAPDLASLEPELVRSWYRELDHWDQSRFLGYLRAQGWEADRMALVLGQSQRWHQQLTRMTAMHPQDQAQALLQSRGRGERAARRVLAGNNGQGRDEMDPGSESPPSDETDRQFSL